MTTWTKLEYDTLTTRPDRDPQYYLLRHLRRRGLLHVDGGGRLARFGRISALKRVCPRKVIEGQLDRIFVAEYEHYVWRVRPHCAYCGVVLTRSTLTRDHIVPRARGGGGGDNLVPACGPCNRAKGARSLLQFLLKRPAFRPPSQPMNHMTNTNSAVARPARRPSPLRYSSRFRRGR